MNLKTIVDAELIKKTESLVSQERELLLSVLHHLREIDRRRLFSSLGFKSLFDFTVRHLGYPEDQAHRRVSAMRLMRELPEIEEQIGQGVISLTHIGLAQTLFRQEKKLDNEMNRETKISVLNQIASKPVREAERITLSLSSAPELAKPDRVRQVTPNVTEFKFTASTELKAKIETLKGRLAHKNPNLSLGELFETLCDLGLSTWDKSSTSVSAKASNTFQSFANSKSNARNSHEVNAVFTNVQTNADFMTMSIVAETSESVGEAKAFDRTKTAAPRSTSRKSKPGRKRTSHAQVVRDLFDEAGNQCENCQSEYGLEIDHVVPRAKGGGSDAYNLRILCRSCNQRAAILEFGLEKMASHLQRL